MNKLQKALELAVADMQYRQREWAWDIKMVKYEGVHALEALKEYDKRSEAIEILRALMDDADTKCPPNQ